MKRRTWILGGLGIAALALAGAIWQFGGVQTKLEYHAFAKELKTCTPFQQDLHDLHGAGIEIDREVIGPEGDSCAIRIDAFGPEGLLCKVPAAQQAQIAQAFRDQARNVGIFGGFSVRISTSDPDPLTVLYNSPACASTPDPA